MFTLGSASVIEEFRPLMWGDKSPKGKINPALINRKSHTYI